MPHRSLRAAWLLVAIAAAAQETGPRIFRPMDQTVVAAGPLSVVARTGGKGELLLDGKPVAATEPGPNALTAALKPSPGMHDLKLVSDGDPVVVRFFVRDAGNAAEAPKDWLEFKSHPPSAGCDACHAVQDGAWGFKGDTLASNCAACHEANAFPEIHTHNTVTLAECQLCHSPHGSTAAKLLKLKKELACKQCHG